jgi:hypothetical protein
MVLPISPAKLARFAVDTRMNEGAAVRWVQIRQTHTGGAMSELFQSILHLETPFNWLSLMGLSAFAFGTLATVVKQIRKFASHAMELRFKRDLIERGLSIDEIERVLAAASRNGGCETR